MTKLKGTTKSLGRKSVSDKFHTKPEIAGQCIELIDPSKYDVVIEPSAGAGSFSKQIPGVLAMDIDPEDPTITKRDWFSYTRPRHDGERVLVIGNPPFGQQSTQAVRFINHAAQFADVIAFVLPLSFKKWSVRNRLDKHLHQILEESMPSNAFTLNGRDYHVPSVFQAWEWREELRSASPRRLVSDYFHFVSPAGSPDVRIARVGGRAGKASRDLAGAAASNYFIRLGITIDVDDFVAYVNSLTFPGREFGVGPRTLSKDELIQVFEDNLPLDWRLA